MPLGINFGGATTGFSGLAQAGVFGPPRSSPTVSLPPVGDSVLGDILNVANFGLDVFQTVRGDNRPAPAPAVPVASQPSSSVPTPPGVTSRFTGNFAPGSRVTPAGPLDGGQQAAMVIGPATTAMRMGVAMILRKIKQFTGARVTTKKLVSAIRQFGFNAVMVWAGVSMAELMVVWERGSRRPRRRFTKRDRSRGRSYIRHLKKQADELKSLGCGPRTRTTRRKC